MASRGLGSLTLDLIAKIGGFVGPLSQAERELDKRTKRMNKMANDFGRSIGSSLKSAAGAFLAFAGVGVSIGAASNAIKGAIDRADQLRDASIRLGIGVETLSAFGYAAQQTGTDIEELNKGLLRLSRNATAALNPKSRQAGLFEALGVSKDALTDLDKLVPQVADAFARLEDGPTKAALALELMGRSGANLIEFFNQGGQGIKDFTARARELGIVITDETAAAADDFNDKLADLKAAGSGLATQVASELLPQLANLVDWATDFVSDGDNARAVADGMTNSFRALADAIALVLKVGSSLGSIRDALAGAEQATRDVAFGLGANGPLAKALKQNLPFLYAPILGGSKQQAPSGPFSNVRGGSDTVSGKTFDNSALARFLSTGGKSGGGSKKASGGKSEAEKEADRLKAAYESMNERLTEQVALYGKSGEAAKVRYELEMGALMGLDPALAKSLIQQAEKIDLMDKEKEAQDELNKITKEREDAINRGIESTAEMISDMEFELSLLGLTNKERERSIALRHADANATDEQRAKVSELSDALYQANETESIVNDLKASLSDAFVDFASGAKSAKDAFGDFADYMYKKALQLLADKAIDALFKAFAGGGGAGGATGGGWMDALFGAFSGQSSGFGFASGGFTGFGSMNQPAGIVHKGEYVMPMNAVSRIGIGNLDSLARGGGIGGNVQQSFYTLGIEDRRTQERKAQLAGREARRAMARTGR